MLLSVIVPVFNEEKYIKKILEKINKIDNIEKQIIVINDNNRYNVKYVSAENEAWTKSWPDQSDPKKNHFEYISNFEWFDIWKNHHGQIIIKKIIPFLIFLFKE